MDDLILISKQDKRLAYRYLSVSKPNYNHRYSKIHQDK